MSQRDRMTVLHLINTMEWGGVRRHILDLADGLDAQGVRSIIAAWIPPDDILHGDPRVTHLPLYDGWRHLKSPGGFFSAIRTLRRLLMEEKVDVLHMHSRYATLLGSMAGRAAAARRVYTAHNTFENLRRLPWYPRDIIAPAEAVREAVRANIHGSERLRITVIPHGVEIPASIPVASDSSPRFCFAGRMCEEKGVRVLYQALLRLKDEGGSFPTVDVLGDGLLLDWLKERLDADFPGLPISVHGFHPNPQELISGSTALLFPSLGLDSAPYITLEAMALAVPVIASDLAVLRGLIIPEQTGLTFPSGDVEAFASVLRRAMKNTEHLRALGLQARELVQQRHGLDRMCTETAALYRSLQQ